MDRKGLTNLIFVATLAVITQLPAFSAKNDTQLIEMPKTYPA